MTTDPREWAGTVDDMHDLHRFGPNQRARCNPNIRTHSRTTDRDQFREPYMTLHTRAGIEASGFGRLYRFCLDCTEKVFVVPLPPES